MADRSKASLKTAFQFGVAPTQQDFSDLIDNMKHATAEEAGWDTTAGVTTLLNSGDNVGIGRTPTERLDILVNADSAQQEIYSNTGAGATSTTSMYLENDTGLVFGVDKHPSTSAKPHVANIFNQNGDHVWDLDIGAEYKWLTNSVVGMVFNNGQLRIGSGSPESILHLDTSTEEFEIIDSGTAAATESSWTEIQTNDGVSYLRGFATK